MNFMNSKIMFVNTDQFNIDAFEEYLFKINRFAEKNGMSVITTNQYKTWTESDLHELYKMKKTIDVDSKMVIEKKVAIVTLEGFNEQDQLRVSNIIEDSIRQYDINILMTDETIKLDTLDAFFKRIETDIGLINKIKSKGSLIPNNTDNDIRYYRGKFAVKQLSTSNASKKALFEVMDEFNEHEVGAKVKLSINQCWRYKK